MSTRVRLGWIGALGFVASACVGGQSGVELDPAPGCEATYSRAIGPTEATPVGTVKDLMAEVGSARSVPLRGFQAGSSALFDTILSLEASLNPATAELSSRPDFTSSDGSNCRTLLTVQAVLHFDTTDGSFSEVFNGIFEVDAGTQQGVFSGRLPLAQHRGSSDLTQYASKDEEPLLGVSTTLAPEARGRLVVDKDVLNSPPGADVLLVAEWPAGDAVIGPGQDGG